MQFFSHCHKQLLLFQSPQLNTQFKISSQAVSIRLLSQKGADQIGRDLGRCVEGQMQTAAIVFEQLDPQFLQQNPQPTDEQITEWMNGNICRCNGYAKILNAVRRAAAQIKEVKRS